MGDTDHAFVGSVSVTSHEEEDGYRAVTVEGNRFTIRVDNRGNKTITGVSEGETFTHTRDGCFFESATFETLDVIAQGPDIPLSLRGGAADQTRANLAGAIDEIFTAPCHKPRGR